MTTRTNSKKRIAEYGDGKSQFTVHFPEQNSWRYRFDYEKVDIEKVTHKGELTYKIDVYVK